MPRPIDELEVLDDVQRGGMGVAKHFDFSIPL
jgi:hypothetical protein